MYLNNLFGSLRRRDSELCVLFFCPKLIIVWQRGVEKDRLISLLVSKLNVSLKCGVSGEKQQCVVQLHPLQGRRRMTRTAVVTVACMMPSSLCSVEGSPQLRRGHGCEENQIESKRLVAWSRRTTFYSKITRVFALPCVLFSYCDICKCFA